MSRATSSTSACSNETCAYQVDSIETVLPHETESLVIRAGEDLCTLVTCTPYGVNSHRLLVHADAIPYVEAMDEAVGKTESFINIPLPYALLMLALAAIGVVLDRFRRCAEPRTGRHAGGGVGGRSAFANV